MFRVAILQNQSESFRSGYADVARNMSGHLQAEGYSFVTIDGGNVRELFDENSENHLSRFDSLFISTNSLSDEVTKDIFLDNQGAISRFLSSGRGVFLGYQKKLSSSQNTMDSDWLLPEPFRVRMEVRPKNETDSSQGLVKASVIGEHSVAPFLLLNNPNEISDELIASHCKENDFKSHVYRSVLIPENEAAFEAVLDDISYGDTRRLMLVNRASFAGERVVVSTVAIDWEGHWKFLENVVRYITEGVPTVAMYSHPKRSDPAFEFVRSSARFLRVTHSEYSSLSVPSSFRNVHNVFLLSSKWDESEVKAFWSELAGPDPKSLRDATNFKRLYQLGDGARSHTSLTRFVNYTAIDVIANEALVWLERQFDGGMWSGSFWASHDILKTYMSLGMDVSSFLPGILEEVKPHLIPGGYDAVMGPSCGLLSLLNSLSENYENILTEAGFGISTRADIAFWILENLESQSDVARQVAARALFGAGSVKTLSELEGRGKKRALSLLRTTVAKALLASTDQVPSLSDIDLVRFIQLSSGNPALEAVFGASAKELTRRQGADGLWSSIALTSLIVVTLIEGVVPKEKSDHSDATRDVVARAVEGLRARFHDSIEPWGGVMQDVALAVQALGLFRATYDVGSQEIFESLEAESRLSRESVGIGKIRVDLKDLFARDLSKDKKIREIEKTNESQRETITRLKQDSIRARRSMAIFRVIGGISSLLFVALLVSFWFGERDALLNVIAGTGSLLGLIIGALIAIPITYLVTPTVSGGEPNLNVEEKK